MPSLSTLATTARPFIVRIALVALASSSLAAGGCMFSTPHATGPRAAVAAHVADAPVQVLSRNGSVELIGETSRSDVQIDANITCVGATQQEADQRLSQASLDVSRDTAHALVIKPVFPGGERDGDGAHFVIRLPNADGIDIKTSNGRVAVTSLRGILVVHTSNGSVTVDDHDGPATIDTSNGSICVSNLHGELKADTSNGSVKALQIGGPTTINSANGSIVLVLNPDQAGPIVLDTSNASVNVKVGRSFRGRVSLDTSNASIGVAVNGRDAKTETKNDSHATVVFADGAASRVNTSNGNIQFEVVE